MRTTERITVRPMQPGDVQAMYELRLRNRAFVTPFEPIRPESDWTHEATERSVHNSILMWEQGQAYHFGVFVNGTGELIGRINLSNVVRAAWQNATLGYYMDQAHNGKGYTTEGLRLVLGIAFEELDLHRVQAGVMPRNIPSIRVLEKAGFRFEGLSERYLCINGVWEDHNMYAITAEEWPR